MRYLNYLVISSLLFSCVALSGCSAGWRAFSKAEKLESEGRFEDAMYGYADAFAKEPEASQYRLRFLNAREKAAGQRFKTGEELFEKQEYGAAMTEYQMASALDPTQERFVARAELARRLKMARQSYHEGMDFEKNNKFKDANHSFQRALELDSTNKLYQAAVIRISGLRKSRLEGYELNLKSHELLNLKFKEARLKDVFNIVTQLSGINFIFDDSVKDQPITIYIENATFPQVMDLLANMNKLGRKLLNETTMMIYARTPEKLKQYEDMTLRTFHLNFMDAKKAVNLIRTMLQVRKLYVNEESNSIVVRDSSDVVDVVEKILDANDVPDPEVVLDVEVIEVSGKNAQTVGLLLSNYNVQLGAFSPAPDNKLLSNSLASITTSTNGTTVTPGGDITNLVRAFSIKGYGGFVTVPNAQYNFGKTLANGEVLSNPKIRIKNKEKSKFNVGTRVPITTTTLNGQLSQVNVQYVDVGVKVNAEPTIQLNNEIVIKLSLEVSSILSKESVGGQDSPTTVVTIGTRNLDTVLSLKDGETSVIGGLIQHTNSDSKTKIFLLGDIPLIGPLLSNNDSSKDKTELILAITPRLVRGVTVPQSSLLSFFSGKEDEPYLVRPLSVVEQDAVFDNARKIAGKQLNGQPVATGGEQMSATPSFGGVVPTQQQSAADSVKPAAPEKSPKTLMPDDAESAQPSNLRGNLLITAPSTVSVGQQFTVEIKATDLKDVFAAPFAVTYDPASVTFISATEGSLLKKDGKPTSFSFTADAAAGTVTVSLTRAAGAGGISDSGTLASLSFSATAKGMAGFGFQSFDFSTEAGQQFQMLPFSTALEIR